MYTKLLEVQKMLLSFKKKGSNPHFKSSYLTLDDLLNQLLPVCNELWILIYHKTENQEVKTTVVCDKEEIVSSFPLWDISNPQKIGSYITYAKRYNLWQIFNIVTDDDDDWNKSSVTVVAKDTTFGKENFTGKNLKSFVAAMEDWKWSKNLEDTVKEIREKYILSDDHLASVEEYHRAWEEKRLKTPTALSK
jgi:hypothetical protein